MSLFTDLKHQINQDKKYQDLVSFLVGLRTYQHPVLSLTFMALLSALTLILLMRRIG